MSRRTQERVLALGLALLLTLPLLAGCEKQPASCGLGKGYEIEESLPLEYAEGFSVDYYQDGLKLITLQNEDRFLVVPEGQEAPEKIDKEIVVLQEPLEHLYLAATSAMCLLDALDCLDHLDFASMVQDRWACENAKERMADGRLKFAGKYSEPDYEQLLAVHCPLAMESRMILHAPDVKEKLEELGIPVWIDQSSLESHPLGRSEWIKCYAALFDKEEEAEKLFQEQLDYFDEAEKMEKTNKSIAFFYISSSGYAVTRRSGDYVTQMLKLAGGQNVFSDVGDPEQKSNSVPLSMEEFYTRAKDADFLVYNSTITGELETLDDLLALNPLLKDFKAVKDGNVWCTNGNIYQETTRHGEMIRDFNRMLQSDGEDLDKLSFLYRLK